MSEDVVIRLSVAQLRELIARAETGNYMIVQQGGQWFRIEPYDPKESQS